MTANREPRIANLIVIVIAMITMTMTSCVSSKKIKYFQGSDTLFTQAQKITQMYEMRIKPADQLSIRLSCDDEELLLPFAQTYTMGVGRYNWNMGGGMGNTNAFIVNKDGQIRMPHIGYITAQNLTTKELERLIEQKIRDTKLIPNPVARVNILSARVVVIGAVRSPGVITINRERTTIIDVLAQCGDVGDASLRQKIRLFREENGKRKMYKLDLTSADIFSHPAYYVQQNDMIYVEHNKSKNISSSPTSTFLSAGSSILGAVISLINMAFWIKNKVK